MALIKCPECSHEVSDTINRCPYCGFDFERQRKAEKKTEKKQKRKARLKKAKWFIIGAAIVILMAPVFVGLYFYFWAPTTTSWLCKHQYEAATCTIPETCKRCGNTIGEPLGHSWTEATCTIPKQCTVCGETEGSPNGHLWTEASCKEAKRCSICGEIEGEPLGHSYSLATCT